MAWVLTTQWPTAPRVLLPSPAGTSPCHCTA
ncbi:Uncharacterised protein [Bordetella pertussis]|nr:Uncharacterised protein [Bordetella pertussis]